jgi:hypothetical protein
MKTNFLPEDWPFSDPQNIAVLTTGKVVFENYPILQVSHDAEDGTWQFHPGEDVDIEDAKIVALSGIAKRDPSILELADLPMGWTAVRNSQDDEWQRFKGVSHEK